MSPPSGAEPARIRFESAAKGSGVTRLSRLNMHPGLKEQWLKELRKSLGCGGTLKDGDILLQGDRRPALAEACGKKGIRYRML